VLLVVDVGNTQTHFGAVRDGELLERWRFATVRGSTSDELGAALRNLLALRGLELGQIDASIISSTVPELGPEWSEMARRYLAHEMLVVGPGVRTGMPIRTDSPRELGADRLVNAVAAYDHYHDACIVVDFGTAITYDIVSAAGEYLGGIISPGMEISLEALWTRAAKLPEVELGEPRALIGKTTVDAVRSGIIYGFASQVDGIITRLRAELGGEVPAIATGGLAHYIVPSFTETLDAVDELLTLKGLQIVWERNGSGDFGRAGTTLE
jgi:type III pantothenate kinase